MTADSTSSHPHAMSVEQFQRFYRAHLAEVYGYLLHLCGGEVTVAEDLNQDVWVALVDELGRGRVERADVRWLITVARSRFLDHVRRERLARSKLGLLRGGAVIDDHDPQASDVLDQMAGLQPLHRAVLMMRYVEELPVPEIAAAIGRPLVATNSLLARARTEMRTRHNATPNDGARHA